MFITLEGMEGSGKSTLQKLLMERLTRQGRYARSTRQPGGCELGRALRKVLLNPSTNICAEAELFLFLADRAQHVKEVIRPALEAGEIVICDRYADSTIVYQGYGRGLDPQVVYTLNHAAVKGLWPDKTLILDLPPTLGLSRAIRRNTERDYPDSEGRFEAETLAFHTRVREGFLDWAAKHPERCIVLDATLPAEELVRVAMRELEA